MNNLTVGQRLKEARTMRGYTLEDVAKAIQTTPTTVSKYEADRVKTIPQKKLDAIASFLKVKPSYLLGYEDTFHASDSSMSITEHLMLEDFRKLSPKYQKVVTSLILSLLEAQDGTTQNVEQLTL